MPNVASVELACELRKNHFGFTGHKNTARIVCRTFLTTCSSMRKLWNEFSTLICRVDWCLFFPSRSRYSEINAAPKLCMKINYYFYSGLFTLNECEPNFGCAHWAKYACTAVWRQQRRLCVVNATAWGLLSVQFTIWIVCSAIQLATPNPTEPNMEKKFRITSSHSSVGTFPFPDCPICIFRAHTGGHSPQHPIRNHF